MSSSSAASCDATSVVVIREINKFHCEWIIPDFGQKVASIKSHDRSQSYGHTSSASCSLYSPTLTFRDSAFIPVGSFLTLALNLHGSSSVHGDILLLPHGDGKIRTIPLKIDLVISDTATNKVFMRVTDTKFSIVAERQSHSMKFNCDSASSSAKVKLDIEFVDDMEEEKSAQHHLLKTGFSTELKHFFAFEDLSDIELVSSDEQSFFSHKALLAARSDVFKTMLSNKESKEVLSGKVELEDMTSTAVRVFLEYLINDKVELNGALAKELLMVGGKYNVQGLKQSASRYLVENCTAANCVENLIQGHLHEEKDLLAAAVKVLFKNKGTIRESQEWKDLKEGHPKVFESICDTLFNMG